MRIAAVLLGVTLFAGPVVAIAQSDIATREGNIWNFQRHEPSAPGVQNAERAAGVALPPEQAQRENQQVEQLERQLTGQQPPPPPQ